MKGRFKSIHSMEFHVPGCMFFSLSWSSLFIFFLDKKSNKKNQGNSPAHAGLRWICHCSRTSSGIAGTVYLRCSYFLFTWAFFAQARKEGWSKQNLFLRSLWKLLLIFLKLMWKILLKQTNVHLLDGKNISFTRVFSAFYC